MKVLPIKPIFALTLVFMLVGCAGGSFDRVRPQAIQPKTADLSGLKDGLSMLVINIKRQKPGLKLRGFVARNLDTQELYSFPFFDNVIMNSRLLQHTLVGDHLQHVVFLDLPPATYQITQMTLFNHQYGYYTGNTSTHLQYDLIQPVKFRILPGKPTDLGQLNIRILTTRLEFESDNFFAQMLKSSNSSLETQPIVLPDGSLSPTYVTQALAYTGQDNLPTMTKAYLDAMSGTVRQLKGLFGFTTPGHDSRVLQRSKGRFPALKNVQFQQGSIWIGQ